MTKKQEKDLLDMTLYLRKTVALVLAGGRGSRLMNLTDWNAKPAVPFAGKFRIVDFALSNCLNSGIRRVGVLTQYKAHSLIQHVQRGWGFLRGELNEFIEIWPAQQRDGSNWYRGTADAVYQNLDIIHSHDPEYVLVLAGDHIYKMDYSQMLNQHISSKADLTIGCLEVSLEDAKAFGVMTIDDDNNIVEFKEKPADPTPCPTDPDKALASMGIYIFNARFMYDHIAQDAKQDTSDHDFGKNIIPALIGKFKVIAHSFNESCVRGAGQKEVYWRDVGTIDAYWEANMDLTHVTPVLNLYENNWPIWSYQPSLPPAKFVFDSDERRGMAVDSVVSGGCIVSGSVVRRCILFSNVRMNSYSTVEDCVLLPGVTVGRHVRMKRCVVDSECVIPANFVIGFDPEEDARRFYRTEKGIVLVTPEMLQALGYQQSACAKRSYSLESGAPPIETTA